MRASDVAELEKRFGIADLRQFTPKGDEGTMGQSR
jgi:hypothetical protein